MGVKHEKEKGCLREGEVVAFLYSWCFVHYFETRLSGWYFMVARRVALLFCFESFTSHPLLDSTLDTLVELGLG